MTEENKAKIYYFSLPDGAKKEEKLNFLRDTQFKNIPFERIRPDAKGNWLNEGIQEDWETLIPLCDKEVKNNKGGNAIFKLFSFGVSTNRDEWVYDFDKINLENKMKFFIEKYNAQIASGITDNDHLDYSIKWSEALKSIFKRKQKIIFNKNLIINSIYRPFIKQYYYSEKLLSDRLTQNHYDMFGRELDLENKIISFCIEPQIEFGVLVNQVIANMHCLGRQSVNLPFYVYEVPPKLVESGSSEIKRSENITNWALKLFRDNYKDEKISKENIFHYVYAVLHNPAYKAKYEQNLKRDFPRIPFYDDFWKWAEAGKQLMELHLNYEQAKPFELETKINTLKNPNAIPKAKLKANKLTGEIIIDEKTTLTGIPKTAWEYKLGNRSALEWILDQYKESKSRDQTIAEKFNTYKFTDYKEEIIELLKKVCTVSVESMKITNNL
jgi:predicted helicase